MWHNGCGQRNGIDKEMCLSIRIEHKVSDEYGRHKENDLSDVSSKHNVGVHTVIVTGVEQLTDTALQHWKKENEPLTVVVSTSTPTASPRVTYRESREPSIGESSSEQEEDEEKD